MQASHVEAGGRVAQLVDHRPPHRVELHAKVVLGRPARAAQWHEITDLRCADMSARCRPTERAWTWFVS
jgi:hypothetical protein